MSNIFDNHGLKYLSPTSLNEYIANPARYILWLTGVRDFVGSPAMWRGTAVDQTVTKDLLDDEEYDIPYLQRYAKSVFNKEYLQCKSEGVIIDQTKLVTELDRLDTYVDVAIRFYRQWGKPVASQRRVELTIPEIDIPIIGYVDLLYDDVVRDVKTTARIAKKLPDSYSPLSVYSKALDVVPLVDYVYVNSTKAEMITMHVENVDEHFEVVRRAAINLKNLLSTSTDINEVAMQVMPNFDDWRWSDKEVKAAKQLWRI